MKKRFHFRLFVGAALVFACASASALAAEGNRFAGDNNITWNTLGKNENDSMPLGNGDLAANVWTEENGDVVILLAKSDAWTELGKLVKLGRLRIHLDKNPFTSGAFTQTLLVDKGCIDIVSGTHLLRIWIDANNPAMHVESHLDQATHIQAKLELWRTAHPFKIPTPDGGGMPEIPNKDIPVDFEADTVFPHNNDHVTWCHFNQQSIFPISFQQCHLASILPKYADPLLHRCFGAALSGPGLTASDDHTLTSSAPSKDLRLDLVALTQSPADSIDAWHSQLATLSKSANPEDLHTAWTAHQEWWQHFWNRSYIHVAGSEDAQKVSQGYAIQRFMIAASARGPQPLKHNGGLFTVGHDMPPDLVSKDANHNPDYRRWGSCYWNQNCRLLYWPLITSGDFDLIKPWFNMYTNALPLAIERTNLYYHHAGAYFNETNFFWGLPSMFEFGWNNPANEVKSLWLKYHYQGGLEVAAQMFDYYEATGDADFARNKLVPFADAIVTFYDEHWQRNADGKIHMSPAQALETYSYDAQDPTPDIAGLLSILPRLGALPNELTTDAQRSAWLKTLHDLPPLPLGKLAKGKLPPNGVGDADGLPTILPAGVYFKTRNTENPELYVGFPYHLYGVGKPDLNVAQNAYNGRLFKADSCWSQDGIEAATFGLTSEAKRIITAEFTAYGEQRFPFFWKAGHDWIPDLDNGGAGMIALQNMLMQCDGKRIQLLPAWPKGWTADFKLHAPLQTTVEAHVENGTLTQLHITPESRAKDVVVLPVQSP